jgi:hypothetical protein
VDVTGGDAVVHLVDRDADVEVLRPEHRLLVRREALHRDSATCERLEDHPGCDRVYHDDVILTDARAVGIDVSEGSRLHADSPRQVGVRATEGQPGRRRDELDVVDPQVGGGDGPEAARGDAEPDVVARDVLRPCEHQLGEAVQRESGALQSLAVHVVSSVMVVPAVSV